MFALPHKARVTVGADAVEYDGALLVEVAKDKAETAAEDEQAREASKRKQISFFIYDFPLGSY